MLTKLETLFSGSLSLHPPQIATTTTSRSLHGRGWKMLRFLLSWIVMYDCWLDNWDLNWTIRASSSITGMGIIYSSKNPFTFLPTDVLSSIQLLACSGMRRCRNSAGAPANSASFIFNEPKQQKHHLAQQRCKKQKIRSSIVRPFQL